MRHLSPNHHAHGYTLQSNCVSQALHGRIVQAREGALKITLRLRLSHLTWTRVALGAVTVVCGIDATLARSLLEALQHVVAFVGCAVVAGLQLQRLESSPPVLR